MSEIIIPRRSVLYMPGANDKALEKAKSLPCDAIIFDTEDSVAPDMKAAAREKEAAAVASGEDGNRELTIRVNGLDTEWFVFGRCWRRQPRWNAPLKSLRPPSGSQCW